MFGHSSFFPTEGESLRSWFSKRILPLVLAIPVAVSGVSVAQAATAPTLGAAESYAVFGKAGVTNDSAVGTTHIWGNVGADATNVTDLNDATQVDGVIDSGAGVEAAILTAYGVLAGQTPDGALDLAGTNTVTPGLYTVGATTLNGTLTLDGAGVYIFRSSSSISTSGPAVVSLINGATPCNVFWQIPAAMTIGAGTQMVGTIITNTELISLAAGATLQGRALSRIAQVTLDSNQITEPTCASEEVAVVTEGRRRLHSPMISVTKIPSPLALPGPGSVTYTYEVSNPGEYTMNNITLADDKCDDVNYVSGDINNDSLLQRTEVWKYSCTTWLTQHTYNVATAIGYANGLPANDIAYATVNVGSQLTPPLIHVVKTPNISLLPYGGGTVTYTYEVSNPGMVSLHYVQVTDNKCNGVSYVSGDVNDDDTLDVNETWTYTCKADLDVTTKNTVTATGNANNETAIDYAFVTVVVAPRPAIVVPVIHSSAPAEPTAPVPTPEVPLLPNTGVGPQTTGIAWEASGLLLAISFVLASYQAKRFLSSKN
jgi:uncharacterized repeat protein (TIGR01451 family)